MRLDETQLRNQFPMFTPCTLAPKLWDLERYAEKHKISIQSVLRSEAEKLYSASDDFGNVYTIQNPVVWTEKIVDGRVIRVRPTATLIKKVDDNQQSNNQRKKRGSL